MKRWLFSAKVFLEVGPSVVCSHIVFCPVHHIHLSWSRVFQLSTDSSGFCDLRQGDSSICHNFANISVPWLHSCCTELMVTMLLNQSFMVFLRYYFYRYLCVCVCNSKWKFLLLLKTYRSFLFRKSCCLGDLQENNWVQCFTLPFNFPTGENAWNTLS